MFQNKISSKNMNDGTLHKILPKTLFFLFGVSQKKFIRCRGVKLFTTYISINEKNTTRLVYAY